jgi:hypothetical protein
MAWSKTFKVGQSARLTSNDTGAQILMRLTMNDVLLLSYVHILRFLGQETGDAFFYVLHHAFLLACGYTFAGWTTA